MHLKIVILGRPNVGKSTLFNKLIKKKVAIVDDEAGVTRDNREGILKINGNSFLVVDTAGFDFNSKSFFQQRINDLALSVILDADICIFLTDLKSGLTSEDYKISEKLRKLKKVVFLVLNKSDVKKTEFNFYEFFELGYGEPLRISAEHNIGLEDLTGKIYDFFLHTEGNFVEDEGNENTKVKAQVHQNFLNDEKLNIVIIGQPNSGKSSLVNSIIGKDRLLTGPEAGITRDSIAVSFRWKNRDVKIFDTAGMRKKSKINLHLEKLSVKESIRAINFAEVVVLIIDSTLPFESQDLRIASLTEREGRALVIVFNKIDLIKSKIEFIEKMKKKLNNILPKIKDTPIVSTSAINGYGIDELFDKIIFSHTVWNKKIKTSKLNEWLLLSCQNHPPPASKGKRVKLRYITQIKSRPPTFLIFVSVNNVLTETYKRYLVNSLRKSFKIVGVPIRLNFKVGKNPYKNKN